MESVIYLGCTLHIFGGFIVDTLKQLLFVYGVDKSDSIESFQFNGPKCNIIYKSSPKVYSYNSCNVQLYSLQSEIDLQKFVVSIHGEATSNIRRLLDFGAYYKAIYSKQSQVYPRAEVDLNENCLAKKECLKRFDYFRKIAGVISLVAGERFNILSHQYDKIQHVSNETVLSSYLSETPIVKQFTPPEILIYPFGLNQSQKKAVENAFSSQISIIQGPPGTGKTQTILNIIANVVFNNKTVAVVSNNNSATHNIVEKLQKEQFDFLTAFLGSKENKNTFVQAQSGCYPDMNDWSIPIDDLLNVRKYIKELTQEIQQRFNEKNRIAEIEQELLVLEQESRYFDEYYQSCHDTELTYQLKLSSTQTIALWNEYEVAARNNKKHSFFVKLRILFEYNYYAFKLFFQKPDPVIPYLQKQFYIIKSAELHKELDYLKLRLDNYAFDAKIKELAEHSIRLFRHELAQRYQRNKSRRRFESTAFYRECAAFNQEYPIVLSTTYSIKNSLGTEHIYDYLIVDESSQVDLATGVLALSCARNVVIVGDLKQLPNVLTHTDIQKANVFWDDSLGENYRFTKHNLLSSALTVWNNAPSVLLREHYRCHPKIINFCNQKFYDRQLIIMTEDHDESDALALYRTSAGNHARGHTNQREVDVILHEVLPKLQSKGYQDIGIITPYRDQVSILQKQLPQDLEIDTVHKFQGREKDVIILTSVDNIISDFVDDYHMLNVAVSRAVKALVVVTSQNPQNNNTNYGDLARYISYHNFEVVDSKIYSVFDLLYQAYAQQRKLYLKKKKKISEYDSENLMYSVLEEILQEPDFTQVGCAVHVSLSTLIRDYTLLSPDEQQYAQNPLTHTDFLLFHKMDKVPLLAIEVDGSSFHAEGSRQAERDRKKNHIFEVCGISLLRLKTDGSGEKEKVISTLKQIMK